MSTDSLYVLRGLLAAAVWRNLGFTQNQTVLMACTVHFCGKTAPPAATAHDIRVPTTCDLNRASRQGPFNDQLSFACSDVRQPSRSSE